MDVARVPQQAHPDLARVGSAACSSVPSRSTWRLRPDANMAMARARASIRATIDASAIASEKVFEPAWLPLEGLLGCGGYPSLAATLAPSAHCARHVPAAEHAAMHYGLLGGALRVGQVVVLLGDARSGHAAQLSQNMKKWICL